MGSLYIKDLSSIPVVQDSVEFPVGDGVGKNAYKINLGQIAEHVEVPVPLIVEDESALTSSVGTLTIASNNIATLSNQTDYDSIELGHVIVIPGDNVPTFVIGKLGSLQLTVTYTYNISTGVSFTYGDPTIVSKDSSGNITNMMAKDSLITVGGFTVKQSAYINKTYFNSGGLSIEGKGLANSTFQAPSFSSYPSVGYNENRSSDLTVLIKRNVDNGFISTPHQPFFQAKMTGDQTLGTSGTWYRVQFDVADGTDPRKTTHARTVSDESVSFDTTNHVFKVPYDTTGVKYSNAAWILSVGLDIYCASVSAGDQLLVTVRGYSAASGGTNEVLMWDRVEFPVSQTTFNHTFNLTSIVYLRPYSEVNHRYLGVEARQLYISSPYIEQSLPSTFFSGACLG